MTTDQQIQLIHDGIFISASDAARRLGVSSRLVRKMLMDQGRIVGREWFFPTEAVDALKETLSNKRCPWCGKQAMQSRHAVTCGGPICTKRQRQSAGRSVKKPLSRESLSKISMSPDAISRNRIAEAMRRELANGEQMSTAVLNVAVAQRESPASVISVWKSVNL